MDSDKFNKDLNELCKKHNLTRMSVILEDLNPYRCAALAGGLHEVGLCPIQSKRGGTDVHISLYTPDTLVLNP